MLCVIIYIIYINNCVNVAWLLAHLPCLVLGLLCSCFLYALARSLSLSHFLASLSLFLSAALSALPLVCMRVCFLVSAAPAPPTGPQARVLSHAHRRARARGAVRQLRLRVLARQEMISCRDRRRRRVWKQNHHTRHVLGRTKKNEHMAD